MSFNVDSGDLIQVLALVYKPSPQPSLWFIVVSFETVHSRSQDGLEFVISQAGFQIVILLSEPP